VLGQSPSGLPTDRGGTGRLLKNRRVLGATTLRGGPHQREEKYAGRMCRCHGTRVGSPSLFVGEGPPPAHEENPQEGWTQQDTFRLRGFIQIVGFRVGNTKFKKQAPFMTPPNVKL